MAKDDERGWVLHTNERVRQFQVLARSKGQRPEQKPYREKSVNDVSNEPYKPSQCDLLGIKRIISNPNRSLPDNVSGPLGCDNASSWRQTEEGWKGEGTYGYAYVGVMGTPKRGSEVCTAQALRVSDRRPRQR